MTQIAIGFFGLLALWFAYSKDERRRRWSPVVGLLGQPAWLYFAWQTQGWGLGALVIAYTAVYAHGAWVQWDLRRWFWRKFRRQASETQCVGCGRELTREEAFHYIIHCERCEGIAMAEMEEAA